MKKRVVIIGCGFAGFYAARRLSKYRDILELTVIDQRGTFDFLPLLPDILGRGINAGCLSSSIEELGRKSGFNFIKDEVISVDIKNKVIHTPNININYDYLIISSGAETNYYGKDVIKDYAFSIDSVSDIKKALDGLKNGHYSAYLISGGGYTGVEVATNLRRYLDNNSANKKVVIIEKSPSILGALPQWMRDYAVSNLKKLKIDIFTDTSIDRIEGGKIVLSGGQEYDNLMLFWVAGVKTAGYIQDLKVDKNPQGRVKVDKFLKVSESCFVVGDCAYIAYQNSFLRMAVQFSIYEALCAADNIIRSIKSRKLKIYQPMDLGYIIPMGNNQSCGRVLGINFKGLLPTLMHFIMCFYRLEGFKNKIGLLKALLKGGF